jgi:hypothetical protein
MPSTWPGGSLTPCADRPTRPCSTRTSPSGRRSGGWSCVSPIAPSLLPLQATALSGSLASARGARAASTRPHGEEGSGRRIPDACAAAIRYRSSPLSVEGPQAPRRGPKAGDRLPDASIVSDGHVSSLHAAITAPGWHLQLCGSTQEWRAGQAESRWERYGGLVHVLRVHPGDGPEAAKPEPGVLHDSTNLALQRLDVPKGVRAPYLVRPDGHVGYRSGGDNLDGLTTYLRWVSRQLQRGAEASAARP